MGDYEQKGLDKLIEDKLILAAANDKGIEVRDDIVDKRMQEIKDRYASEEDFINALNSPGDDGQRPAAEINGPDEGQI